MNVYRFRLTKYMVRQSNVLSEYYLQTNKKIFETQLPPTITQHIGTELLVLFKNLTLRKLVKFIYNLNQESGLSLEQICWQLVLFAKFFSWDLLLDLLEYYSLEICKGASFGLLEIYFETFGPFVNSPRRENYFKNVCNLYRLPGDYVRRLLAEYTLGFPRRFLANKLKTKVIKQVNTDWYDQPRSPSKKIQCAVCTFQCPAPPLILWTRCCSARVHERCRRDIDEDTPCAVCDAETLYKYLTHTPRNFENTEHILYDDHFEGVPSDPASFQPPRIRNSFEICKLFPNFPPLYTWKPDVFSMKLQRKIVSKFSC